VTRRHRPNVRSGQRVSVIGRVQKAHAGLLDTGRPLEAGHHGDAEAEPNGAGRGVAPEYLTCRPIEGDGPIDPRSRKATPNSLSEQRAEAPRTAL
jgi:hypothetical protein